MAVVARLEFDTDPSASVDDRSVDLGADPHEGRQDSLAGVTPEVHAPLDDVELERVHVLLVVRLFALAVREHAVKPHVVPEGRRVLSR